MRSNPEALKRIRETAGHSQASLSRDSDVAQSHISKLERTPVAVRPPTALRLAVALGVDITAITVSDEHAEVAS